MRAKAKPDKKRIGLLLLAVFGSIVFFSSVCEVADTDLLVLASGVRLGCSEVEVETTPEVSDL